KWGTCFAKFSSTAHARAAVKTLRWFSLSSNSEEGIQVDFAKNELDQPRGAAVSHSDGGMQRYSGLTSAPIIVNPPPPAVLPQRGSSGGRHPCDTMFVGNLAPNATEDELGSALACCNGFEKLKFVGSGDKVMAWAQFSSVAECAEAMEVLGGSALPSAPSHALSCEFAKNSLGKTARSF
ncbi:unnamed protein product, partial [Polarella glacialis]